jgi:large subunit ribosomal protein L1
MEYRAEKAGVVHAGVGKASFNETALVENIQALSSAILKARPAGVKGSFIKSVFLSSTMGPSVQLDLADIQNG